MLNTYCLGCVLCYTTGLLLISLALCADAIIGNVQEKTMKLHNGSNSEMVCSFLKTLNGVNSLWFMFLKSLCVELRAWQLN